MNVFCVNDSSQTEIHGAEPLVCLGWGGYWKYVIRYEWPNIEQIAAEFGSP